MDNDNMDRALYEKSLTPARVYVDWLENRITEKGLDTASVTRRMGPDYHRPHADMTRMLLRTPGSRQPSGGTPEEVFEVLQALESGDCDAPYSPEKALCTAVARIWNSRHAERYDAADGDA